MRKAFKLFVSIAVAAVLLSANPAAAGGGGAPAYRTIYYSDATHQNQVGVSNFNYCLVRPWGDEVRYHLSGTQTIYYTRELVGYCMDGEYFDA
jgi:hypothetical protein